MTTKIPVELSSTPGIADSSNATAITIDSSENVGIGVTSPQTTFGKAGTLDANGVIIARGGLGNHETDAIALEYYNGISRLRAYGASAGTGILAFNTGGGGDSTDTERMRIDSSGNVGIGNTNPTERLHVQAASINSDVARITGANADRGLLIKTDAVGATNDVFVIFDVDHSAGHIGFQTNSVEAMRITNGSYVGIGDTSPAYRLELPNTASAAGQGRANNWIVYSDSRIKSNIQVLNYGLDIVKQLKPSKYKHHNSIKNDDGQFVKLDEGANDIGFIAQEVLPLMPEVVAIPEDTDKDLYSLNYPKLTAVLTKAIQEQQDIIDDLKSRIETLEG